MEQPKDDLHLVDLKVWLDTRATLVDRCDQQETEIIATDLLSPDRRTPWLPKTELWPWAIGVLESVLRHKSPARHDYAEIVTLWNCPEYEPMFDDYGNLLCSILESGIPTEVELIKQFPAYMDLSMEHLHDNGTDEMRNLVSNFIENHFNSDKAKKWGHLQVIPSKAYLLRQTIMFRSMSDCAEIDHTVWERWPTNELEKEMNKVHISNEGNPWVSRTHRQISELIHHKAHAKFITNDRIRRWCDIWYLARIDPGQVNKAADILADENDPYLVPEGRTLSEFYISTHIRPADKATRN